jgi:hypothetical protein
MATSRRSISRPSSWMCCPLSPPTTCSSPTLGPARSTERCTASVGASPWTSTRTSRGDFLQPGWPDGQSWDWIIGNPPFNEAERHVRRALDLTSRHVAFLLRTAFLESTERVPFWTRHQCDLRKVFVLAQRPSFGQIIQGQETMFGSQVIDFDNKTDSCAYGWFWFDLEHDGPSEIEVLPWK